MTNIFFMSTNSDEVTDIEHIVLNYLRQKKSATFTELIEKLCISENNRTLLLRILRKLETSGVIKREQVSIPVADGIILTSKFMLNDNRTVS